MHSMQYYPNRPITSLLLGLHPATQSTTHHSNSKYLLSY